MTTIQIFTTGGSMDKFYSTAASDFLVGDPAAAQILQEANVNLAYEVESLLRKDSLEITDADRAMVVERVAACPHAKIIVTHGTDTMVQTAKALQGMPEKTIVVTGAMQPAAFRATDAVFNFGGSIAAVQSLPAGVYIVMSGRVFPVDNVQKNHQTDQFEALA